MGDKFLLKLPPDLRRRIELAAYAENTSMTWIIQTALDQGLPNVNEATAPPQR